jgi:Ras-related protein Rab-18
MDYFIKVLLVGDANVGKSTLMLSFTEGEFKKSLIGTAGIDYKLKNIEFGGKTVKI